MNFPRKMKLVASALAISLAVGCSMTNPPATQATAPSLDRAVIVTGGNAGTTELLIPSSDGKGVTVLTSGGTATCKQCQEDAFTYFETGHLIPKCPQCGATRTAVAMPSGHSG
jgi:hypothetical protein